MMLEAPGKSNEKKIHHVHSPAWRACCPLLHCPGAAPLASSSRAFFFAQVLNYSTAPVLLLLLLMMMTTKVAATLAVAFESPRRHTAHIHAPFMVRRAHLQHGGSRRSPCSSTYLDCASALRSASAPPPKTARRWLTTKSRLGAAVAMTTKTATAAIALIKRFCFAFRLFLDLLPHRSHYSLLFFHFI